MPDVLEIVEPLRAPKYSYAYPLSATASGVADFALLTVELAASALSVQPLVVSSGGIGGVRAVFLNALSDADKAVLDAVVAAHTAGTTALLRAKSLKSTAVDARTTRLIASSSFGYGGKSFSMTSTAQFNTHVMWSRRDESGFAYPVVRATKDNASSVSLADVAAVEAFYDASESAVRAILDAGTALKAQINAAVSVAAVNAISDNR